MIYTYARVSTAGQCMYNFMRAKPCLITLHGKKPVDVAQYEWEKHANPFNSPKDHLWTYDGRKEVEKRTVNMAIDGVFWPDGNRQLEASKNGQSRPKEKATTFPFEPFILESTNNPGKELHERKQK